MPRFSKQTHVHITYAPSSPHKYKHTVAELQAAYPDGHCRTPLVTALQIYWGLIVVQPENHISQAFFLFLKKN